MTEEKKEETKEEKQEDKKEETKEKSAGEVKEESTEEEKTEDQQVENKKEENKEENQPETEKKESQPTVDQPKTENSPAEAPKEEKNKEEKPEPSGKFKDLIKQIEDLSVIELSELVKDLEDRFGVSAAAPMTVAQATGDAGGGEEAKEEKSSYTVVLAAVGGNKIAAIKAVREVNNTLGLKEAKDLVEGAPKTIKENVPKEEAEEAKKKLEETGATVELK